MFKNANEVWSATLMIEVKLRNLSYNLKLKTLNNEFEAKMWEWGVELNLEEKKFPN